MGNKYNDYDTTPFQFLCDEKKRQRMKFPDYVGRESLLLPGFYETLFMPDRPNTPVAEMSRSEIKPLIYGENPQIMVMYHRLEEGWFAARYKYDWGYNGFNGPWTKESTAILAATKHNVKLLNRLL